MAWHKCSCNLSWWCSTDESKRKTLERCKAKHVDEAKLVLPETPAKLSNALFLILSHADNHGVHNPLLQELKGMGANKVHVIYGYRYGTDEHMGKKLQPNEIVHYSVRHRWFTRLRKQFQVSLFFFCILFLFYSTFVRLCPTNEFG